MMEDWTIRGLVGLFMIYIIADLIILIFRWYSPKLIWSFVSLVFLLQILHIFYLGKKSIPKLDPIKLGFSLFLVMCGLFLYCFVLEEWGGTGTILHDLKNILRIM